ncbi:MAG: hypothetical protein JSC161_000792 [Candidatus Tokpelaia sp. JSC161]|jgi:hypothetical protein|nr:MAG: hypothetical protein JSC161_000792 [Candidatus Tokpelaia sp. JSC161]
MPIEDNIDVDEHDCRLYGFKPKTNAFANCLMQMELDRRANMRQQNQVNFEMFEMGRWY